MRLDEVGIGVLRGDIQTMIWVTIQIGSRVALYEMGVSRRPLERTDSLVPWADTEEVDVLDFQSQQDDVNRLKKAVRWQCGRLHMKIPNFGEAS